MSAVLASGNIESSKCRPCMQRQTHCKAGRAGVKITCVPKLVLISCSRIYRWVTLYLVEHLCMHKGELSSVDYLSVKQMETPPYRHRHVVPVEDSFSNVSCRRHAGWGRLQRNEFDTAHLPPASLS